MRARIVCLALCLLAAAASGGEARPQAAPCVPRVGEKLGVRFVEVCASDTDDWSDAEAHAGERLPAFWITATPVPCSFASEEAVGCDVVTALEVSPVSGPGKNRSLDALVVEASLAQRVCTQRFGGRLPTPIAREQARQVLGLASLLVREAPGDYASLWLDDLPEWVAEGDCGPAPAPPGPACRVTQFPPVQARPRRAGDALLECVAEPARQGAAGVAIGGQCLERPSEGGVRSPDCAVVVPGPDAAFELGCAVGTGPGVGDPTPDRAGFRCVVDAQALGQRPATGP